MTSVAKMQAAAVNTIMRSYNDFIDERNRIEWNDSITKVQKDSIAAEQKKGDALILRMREMRIEYMDLIN